MKSVTLVAFFVFALSATCNSQPTEIEFSRTSDAQKYNQTQFWGTYRPNVYLGMKTRSVNPFMWGIMWQGLEDLNLVHDARQRISPSSWFGSAAREMRHTCEEGDKFQRYGWTHHDGMSYGSQELLDKANGVKLTTEFIKKQAGDKGGHWSVKIKGEAIKRGEEPSVSLFAYFGSEESGATFDLPTKSHRKGIPSGQVHLKGNTPELGDFSIFLKESENNHSPKYSKELHKVKGLPDIDKFHFMGSSVHSENVWRVKDNTMESLKKHHSKLSHEISKSREKVLEKLRTKEKDSLDLKMPLIVPTLQNSMEEDSNLVVFQRILTVPFEIEIIFISYDPLDRSGLSREIANQLASLSGSTLSDSLVESKNQFQEKFQQAFPLSGFPKDKTEFAMAAFSNLIGGMGYFYGRSIVHLPGKQAPELSPPAALYTAVPSRPFFPRGFLWDEGFHQLLVSQWNLDITMDVLKHWYSLMDSNGWIPREQILGDEARSKVPQEFQVQFPNYANPPTLLLVLEKINQRILREQSSELQKYKSFLSDIYPLLERQYNWFERTQNGIIPNSFRWRGRTENHTLTSGLDDYPRASPPSDKELHLDLLCWMAMASRVLSDIGSALGRPVTKYQEKYTQLLAELDAVYWNEEAGSYSDVLEYSETGNKLNGHKGYISLFPLFMKLIPKDSTKLQKTLQMIRDSKQLWSPYGVRSLSISDPLFGTNENYWRGPIWINCNYMLLSALHTHYSNDGPYKQEAKQIYNELRTNIISNLFENYRQTGYIWEQYNSVDGRGQRSHPFTGWSSLVVLIMAEMY